MEKDMIKKYKTHTEIDTSIEGIIQGAFDTTNIKEIPIEKINTFIENEYCKEYKKANIITTTNAKAKWALSYT